MENNKNYLQFLFNEEIFVIEGDENSMEDSKKGYTQSSEINEPKVEEPLPSTDASTKQEEKPASPELAISGDPHSDICIINYDSQHDFIATEQQAFLENILKAVKLEISKVALVNKANTDVGILEIIQKVDANTFIIFADTDAMNKYVITQEGNKQLLAADSLVSISSDKEKKKALWTNLQQIFLK